MDYDDTPGTSRSMRGRNLASTSGRPLPMANSISSIGRQQTSLHLQLQHLESEAYSAVLLAFGAQSEAITWAKERLMSDLRKELNIDDELHRKLLDKVHTDPLIIQISRLRKAQEMGGSFRMPSPPVLDTTPAGLGRKKSHNLIAAIATQASTPPLPAAPTPSAAAVVPAIPKSESQVFATPAVKPPSSSKRGPPHKKAKKGRGKKGKQKAAAPVGQPVHPFIGRRLKMKWTNDDGTSQYYESIISDYREDTREFGLVYDIGTKDESWEWVDFDKIPREDVIWIPGPPVPLIPRGVSEPAVPVAAAAAAAAVPAVVQPEVETQGGDMGSLDFEPFDVEGWIAENGASDILDPIRSIINVDNIEEEMELWKLERAKSFVIVSAFSTHGRLQLNAKLQLASVALSLCPSVFCGRQARESALKRALEELGDTSSEEEDEGMPDTEPNVEESLPELPETEIEAEAESVPVSINDGGKEQGMNGGTTDMVSGEENEEEDDDDTAMEEGGEDTAVESKDGEKTGGDEEQGGDEEGNEGEEDDDDEEEEEEEDEEDGGNTETEDVDI